MTADDIRRLSTIATASGRLFCLADPRPEDVDVDDIATHLSRLARFTGAARGRYSVAQHSVMVSLFVSPEHARHGLLHDAAEAYVGDTSAPMKRLARQMGCTFLDDLEHRVWLAIAERFDLDPMIPLEVKAVDVRMCATEQRHMTKTPEEWCEADPISGEERMARGVAIRALFDDAESFIPIDEHWARSAFLRRFDALWPQWSYEEAPYEGSL